MNLPSPLMLPLGRLLRLLVKVLEELDEPDVVHGLGHALAAQAGLQGQRDGQVDGGAWGTWKVHLQYFINEVNKKILFR